MGNLLLTDPYTLLYFIVQIGILATLLRTVLQREKKAGIKNKSSRNYFFFFSILLLLFNYVYLSLHYALK